jgi:2-oxoglutarate dehydrogenase E1 component
MSAMRASAVAGRGGSSALSARVSAAARHSVRAQHLKPAAAGVLSHATRPVSTTAAQPSVRKQLSESFLDGSSAEYVEAMHSAWQKDPASVHPAWASFFANDSTGLGPGDAYMSPPGLHAGNSASGGSADVQSAVANALRNVLPGLTPGAQSVTAGADKQNVARMIDQYRTNGYHAASTDPLGLRVAPWDTSGLDHKNFNFTDADLDRDFDVSGLTFFGESSMKLRDIIDKLKSTYTGSIGMEFEHIDYENQKQWIRERFEGPRPALEPAEKKALLDRLTWADTFENFLHKKFGQDKRFGLDGCEILIPAMKEVIDWSAGHGVETVVIGMPHRGRLNVLANVLRKPLAQILKEFDKSGEVDADADDDFHTGDVKYHLGTSFTRPTANNKKVHLALLANPSHLEAVDPLVEGKTRAVQDYAGDTSRKHALSIQLHGDAAFAGQGVVYETLLMSGLEHYTTGGTIHIIVNNLIGFTTNPEQSARGNCTDVAKSAELPVFHVNADDPEACLRVARLAADWRAEFGTDAIIDLVCYRRFGHNELDEPKFTQPARYDKIATHPDAIKLYVDQLVEEGVITHEEFNEQYLGVVNKELERQLEMSKDFTEEGDEWLETHWKGFHGPTQKARIRETGVPEATLVDVGERIASLPDSFRAHPAIKRDMKRKHEAIFGNPHEKLLDWGTAEALAFGSLLLEGNTVRLSGQDVERGTFSHRHAVLTDQVSGDSYTPLNHLSSTQAKFDICNSPLSEFGVLGFETGYSLESPNALVLWEAQFGDFANGAQVIIDQFIVCGEAKWRRQSGLTLLLPHGYDGQGPEHSSARLERFLQMCDGDSDEWPFPNEMERRATETQIQNSNLQVVNCTTPAQYFHVLRRQVHRTFRKPLVVMSPKNLLRHPLCKSSLMELANTHENEDIDVIRDGIRFERVFGETEPEVAANVANTRRVILCSGKVYYDLLQDRTKRGITDVALLRVEQLAPFPWLRLHDEISKFGSDVEVVWAQEEPKNQGAWGWCRPRLNNLLKESGREVGYVGREPMAAPATGILAQHKQQLAKLFNDAFE